MDWQLVPVALIVAAALGYLGRATWRSWRTSKAGCGGGCGCGAKAGLPLPSEGQTTLISTEQLTTRLRQPG